MDITYFETLHLADKAYDQRLQPVYRKWGLTRCALDTLLFLGNNPGLDRAADVVKHRGIAKSHVSAAVRELEQHQLLRRCRDAADGRNARLSLTETGEEVLREGQAQQSKFFEIIFTGLSREDLQHWREITQLVSRNIRELGKEDL